MAKKFKPDELWFRGPDGHIHVNEKLLNVGTVRARLGTSSSGSVSDEGVVEESPLDDVHDAITYVITMTDTVRDEHLAAYLRSQLDSLLEAQLSYVNRKLGN